MHEDRQLPYIADAACLRAATDLIDRHGAAAGDAAASRASDGRRRGNVVDFCRWRQIGRLIDILTAPGPYGTLH